MKWRSKTFLLFVVLAIVYASISLIAAPPRATLQQYHLSSTSMRLVNVAVVVPVLAVWFLALYGYQKLRAYSALLGHTKEDEQVKSLTRGVMVLAFWLPISSTVSAALNLLARSHPAMVAPTTIFLNYMSLLFPLVALILISKGARGLGDMSKERLPQSGVNVMAIVIILAGVTYGYLIAKAGPNLDAIYHLPLTLVLLTLAVPYIFSWFLGLLSAFYIHVYSKNVTGVIYRKSWNMLAFGIGWIILFLVVLQYTTAVSARLGNLSLIAVLLLVYGALLLMGLGFAFLAIGAKKLKKIEEV